MDLLTPFEMVHSLLFPLGPIEPPGGTVEQRPQRGFTFDRLLIESSGLAVPWLVSLYVVDGSLHTLLPRVNAFTFYPTAMPVRFGFPIRAGALVKLEAECLGCDSPAWRAFQTLKQPQLRVWARFIRKLKARPDFPRSLHVVMIGSTPGFGQPARGFGERLARGLEGLEGLEGDEECPF